MTNYKAHLVVLSSLSVCFHTYLNSESARSTFQYSLENNELKTMDGRECIKSFISAV